jgi:hypothetical protein
MADSKITALTALTAADPANDMMPIVDVSDTSMAASGTTKRISINNILACSPSATLASATISGDLTVDTSTFKVNSGNNNVGIGFAGNASSGRLQISQPLGSTIDGALRLTDDATTSFVFNNVSSGLSAIWSSGSIAFGVGSGTFAEAMRLNSTGLGVGTASPGYKLVVAAASGNVMQFENTSDSSRGGRITNTGTAGTGKFGITTTSSGYGLSFGIDAVEKMLLDTNGNVGVGITPSAWATTTTVWRALDMQYSCGLASSGAGSGEIDLLWNAYYDQTDQRWEFKYTGDRASRYSIGGAGVHTWYNTASTGTANNPITWNPAMTLDASGNLLVGKTASSTTVAGSQVQPDGTFSAVKTDANPGLFYNTTTAISGTIALFRSNGVTVGSISQDGTNTAYNNSSDYRLKESVQPLTGGLDRVNALKPSIYKWKTNGKVGEGFLAHELAEVVPFAVTGEKDAVTKDGEIEPQQVDLSKVVPILVAAIKELTAEVNALKNA